jgi:hypothetical protein
MDAKARPLAGRHRIAHELREYAGITLYLYVYFQEAGRPQ